MQDAFILGRVLTHPLLTRTNASTALSIYDAVRRPIGNDIVERSLRLGFLYELHPDYLPAGVDVAKVQAGELQELEKLIDEFKKIWRFHWSESPERDWGRASALLQERLEPI